ncbi:hypothetical protein CC86DRAFT_369661 [Ophiobolus disseminans]|uniref:Letm1 RBD domain-containing protein n=1 Tax=Ophiobolus disseminans TaxID=1469910 RepID=A0A6A7A2M1_9PLEO|nr:hypothetical protein CC86DRAFT_369661 [Ophiobolus disseminans]
MKPPPTISSFGTRTPHLVRYSLQRHRNLYIRAIAPALSCQLWHDGSRGTIHDAERPKSWIGTSKRHRSTATAPAQKSSYGRAAPPPAKTNKTNVPAKPSHSTQNTTAVSTASKSHASTQVPMARAKESLNPPPFTHAPELAVPARKSNQGYLSYLWKAGRSYLSFYKTGVSNVRQTSKLARTLREKAAKHPNSDVLTRAEWQIVQRSKKDMLRLPAFGAIFLIFGEWTPLLVMYITPLIPEPCRIPNQVQRDLEKTEKARKERSNMNSAQMMRLMHKDRGIAGADPSKAKVSSQAESIRTENALQLTHLDLVLASARYNCHSRLWDLLFLTPPKFWLQRNVRKKYEYLRTDDRLIERDGGCQALDWRETQRAAIERGFDVAGKKEEDVRRSLATWWSGGRLK